MNYFLALLPITVVLGLMLLLRWSSQKAGPAGWLAGLAVAGAAFGLNWNVFWVSQTKGLLLSLNVLLILWTALFLYNLVDQIGGIAAVAEGLSGMILDLGWLQIIMAWALTGVVEGLAGFGLPMAIVAPMLVALGVSPIAAVAATAIGHAWAATFGNMGVVLQMLASVVNLETGAVVPAASLLLGIACIGCGLAAAGVLGKLRYWRRVLLLGILMAVVQAAVAYAGLEAMGSFFASAAGIGAGILMGRRWIKTPPAKSTASRLLGALLAYGMLTGLMIVTSLSVDLRSFLGKLVWQLQFPQVVSNIGVVTAPSPGQIFRPFIHPAFLILIAAVTAYIVYVRTGLGEPRIWNLALHLTLRSAGSVTMGVISMVGLSTLMDHAGMTLLLAQGLAQLTGAAFPLVSPLIGMLGAFATGSNSNSNVLFGPMQKSAALVLGIDATMLLGGQTAGGSLGSMIAPAKLLVGCSTTGLEGQDGLVLRKTLPVGLGLGLFLGFVILGLISLR